MNSTNSFYISGMTEDQNGGIFHCVWRNNAPQIEEFHPLERNLCLAWAPDRKTLYASSQHDGIGSVAAYSVDPQGKLHHLNTLPASGRSVCFLQASACGRFLYSANYASGNISEFTIAPDGSLAALKQTIDHSGCSVHPEQTSPHPHCCIFTPDEKYLCVADLGTDKLLLYAFDPEHGISPAAVKAFAVAPGSGPRQLLFDAQGRFLYTLCELGNTIHRFSYSNGELHFIDAVSTLPPEAKDSSAAALKFSPDGKLLYASNRGDDSIAVFTVESDGKIFVKAFYSSGGSSPRDFNFLPGKNIIVAANEFSREAAFFNCDPASGVIASAPCGKLTMPRPLYILL